MRGWTVLVGVAVEWHHSLNVNDRATKLYVWTGVLSLCVGIRCAYLTEGLWVGQ